LTAIGAALQRLAGILRTVFLTTAIGVAAAAVFAQSTGSRYSASATFLIEPAGGAQTIAADRATQIAQSYAQLVLEPVVTEPALSGVSGEEAPEISAENPAGTSLLVITVTDHQAEVAAQLANAIADAFERYQADLNGSPTGQSDAPGLDTRAVLAARAIAPTESESLSVEQSALLGGLAGLVVGVGIVAIAISRTEILRAGQ
jgi:capsular polysaccharide biosynthesis protein